MAGRIDSISRIALGFATLGLSWSHSATAADAVGFAPHRAVYEVTLEQTTPGSGIAELAGRMVYELKGAPCEGFEQSFRYVTVSQDQEGTTQIGDLRSRTWEDADGTRFRFATQQYQDHKIAAETQGEATRARGRVKVELTKPTRRTFEMPASVVFPIQHASEVIAAARAGRFTASAELYDGSEKGEKVSYTTAVIGKKTKPGASRMTAALQPADKLASVTSWPVSIGFFAADKGQTDAVPETEQSYRFFENGVSTDLVSDFGDYTLRFELKELAYLPPPKCAAPPRAAPPQR